ncbi:unknown [Mycoplasma sp. CAG:877]|nr:unknown [Mycoplasma sp. CAG:877]
MEKDIKNIVFYTFESETGKRTQACVFYTDGTVKNTNEEEGVEDVITLMKSKGIGPKEYHKIVNKHYVYETTGEDFEEDFKEYLNKKEKYIAKKDRNIKALLKRLFKKQKSNTEEETEVEEEQEEQQTANATSTTNNNESSTTRKAEANKTTAQPEEENTENAEEEREEDTDERGEKFWRVLQTITGVNLVWGLKEKYLAKKRAVEEANKSKPKKEEGKFKKWFKKTFIGKITKRVAALITAVTILFVSGCSNAKTEKGPETTPTTINETQEINTDDLIKEVTSFAGMLKLSKSDVQKAFMNNISESLDNFNIKFANAYVEKDKNIKAALSWDEVISLALVYNDYNKDQLIQIFNGADLNTTKLEDAYKTGVLQLMGAHVIETRENKVDMSSLLESQEAKDFYEKYHELFLKCKEATGQEQINRVNEFYQESYKDFPITEKVREEGIAHSDSRNSIETYKFSIIPMVSAAEMLYQNLAIDKTLQDKAVAYLNDIGVCNRANDVIEKAALVNLSASKNNDYIDYNLLNQAKITELIDEDAYVVDDAHRDLSELDSFKNKVNVSFTYTNGTFTGEYTTTTTKYRTETTSTTTTNRSQAVSSTSENKVAAAERQASSRLGAENAQARREAEKAADAEAKRQQEQADAERRQQEEKIAQDEKDLQDKINQANKDINNGQTVNEDDFGDHNVDFDNDHSDNKGNLNDSVKDVTTDGTGDKTNEPLPDPNADDKGNSNSSSDQPIYEYEEPYTMTKEEKAAAIVEAMANAQTEEQAKVYTYHN